MHMHYIYMYVCAYTYIIYSLTFAVFAIHILVACAVVICVSQIASASVLAWAAETYFPCIARNIC